MTHIICRLTAKNRDQLRNPTLGNRVWATFTFLSTVRCIKRCSDPSVRPSVCLSQLRSSKRCILTATVPVRAPIIFKNIRYVAQHQRQGQRKWTKRARHIVSPPYRRGDTVLLVLVTYTSCSKRRTTPTVCLRWTQSRYM